MQPLFGEVFYHTRQLLSLYPTSVQKQMKISINLDVNTLEGIRLIAQKKDRWRRKTRHMQEVSNEDVSDISRKVICDNRIANVIYNRENYSEYGFRARIT